MKKLLIIFFSIFTFSAQAQEDPYVQELDSTDEFFREIDWKFYPDSVVRLSDSIYIMIALPYDYNDPGAVERIVGNYIRDYVGHTFEVIDSLTTDRTITVYDRFKTGEAPQSSQVAKCYLSVMSGIGKEVGSVDYTPLEFSARWRLNGMDNERLYRHGMVYDDPFLRSVLDTTYTPTGTEPKGTSYWDDENRTYSIVLGNGVIIQVNQEAIVRVYNNTGDTLKDGMVIGYSEIVNNLPAVAYASNNERHTFLGITTEDILADSVGLAVSLIGVVNNVNTGDLTVGPIYLDSLGYLTSTRPSFPKYIYPLGACLKVGTTDGTIQFRSDGVNYKNSILDAFDGAIRETFDFRTYSDGVNTYGVLSNPTGGDKLTLMFSDGWWDFMVPDTITLTSGSATVPQLSYVYIDKATKTLQSSTSGFPEPEHAEIAKMALLDAANTQTYGALRNQNTNNHLKYDDNNGHIVHMGDRIRVLNAQWETGVAATVSGTPTDFYISTTSGFVWQMHKQAFQAQDMTIGDDVHIVNDPTTPYRTTTNLNTVTVYSDGTTWNNEWTNITLWGVANKTGETSHLMINLSSGGYLSEENAYEDADNLTNYTIPRTFRGVGFLIGRFTVRRSPAGYTYNPSTGFLDLRGYYPNNTAGGGAGGSSGITDFTQLYDTPSSYLGSAGYFTNVTALEDGLEFVAPSSIQLIDFDSTGVNWDQSQVVGLVDSLADHRTDINQNASDIANHGLQEVTDIDSITTHEIIHKKAKSDTSSAILDQVVNYNKNHFASEIDISQTDTIVCWGNSLTAGSGGGGVTYPSELSIISGNYTYNNGISGETSTQIKARFLSSPELWNLPTIFWVGRNNISTPDIVLSDISEMIDSISHKNYLILSILNGEYTTEYYGEDRYNTIKYINESLKYSYGNKFVDVRASLVEEYDKSLSQDLIDYAHDIVPASLRSDAIHLNPTGYRIVAEIVYGYIFELIEGYGHIVSVGNLRTINNKLGSLSDGFIPYWTGTNFSDSYLSNQSLGTLQFYHTSAPTLRIRNETGLILDRSVGKIDFYTDDASGDGAGVISRIESINEDSYRGIAGIRFLTGSSLSLSEKARITNIGNLVVGGMDNGIDRIQSYGSLSISTGSGIYVRTSNTTGLMDFDFSGLTTANGNYRYGRDTNTGTGGLFSMWYVGNGSSTEAMSLNHKTKNLVVGGVVYHAQGTLPTQSALIGDLTGGTQPINGSSLSYGGTDILDIISDSVATGGGDGYVSSATFNTGTGVITLNDPVNGAKTVDIDGRFGILGSANTWTTTNNFGSSSTNRTVLAESFISMYGTNPAITIKPSSVGATYAQLAGYSSFADLYTQGYWRMRTDGSREFNVKDDGIYANLDAATTSNVVYYNTTTDEFTYGAASGGGVTFGSATQIPFMNTGGTDFSYTSNLTYSAGGFTVGAEVNVNGFDINIQGGSPAIAFVDETTDQDDFEIVVNSNEMLLLNTTDTRQIYVFGQDGSMKLNQYGSGSFTGTAAYNLEIDDFGNVVETTAGSDFRMKNNFRTLHNSLNKILALNTYAFDWIKKEELPKTAQDIPFDIKVDNDYNKRESAGVIAQEIINVIPEAVKQYNNGYYKVDYEAIIPHLIEAIKEQQKQIDELRKQINAQ